MTDVHSKEKRSFNMSRIRGKDTKPEMIVRRFLFSRGFRYRLHPKELPGKPDIVLPKFKTIIFVHGCFWHGHAGCRYFVMPKTRTEWWKQKIDATIQKDYGNIAQLESRGWRVIIIWECELRGAATEKTLHGLENRLKE